MGEVVGTDPYVTVFSQHFSSRYTHFYGNGHFSYGWNNSCKLFRTQVLGLEMTNVQFVACKWLQAEVTYCKILYKLLPLYVSLVLHSSVLSNVYGFN